MSAGRTYTAHGAHFLVDAIWDRVRLRRHRRRRRTTTATAHSASACITHTTSVDTGESHVATSTFVDENVTAGKFMMGNMMTQTRSQMGLLVVVRSMSWGAQGTRYMCQRAPAKRRRKQHTAPVSSSRLSPPCRGTTTAATQNTTTADFGLPRLKINLPPSPTSSSPPQLNSLCMPDTTGTGGLQTRRRRTYTCRVGFTLQTYSIWPRL